jgi:hypothetical protein
MPYGDIVTRVILTGGLGNQIFKALGALNCLGKSPHEITFDISWYKKRNFASGDTATRKFELGYFPKLSLVKVTERNFTISTAESRLISRHPRFAARFGYATSAYCMSAGRVIPKVVKSDFESLDALPSPQEISELLRFSENTSSWLDEMKGISKAEQPVAILLGEHYYKNALEIMSSELGKRPIWLFSDDPAQAMNEFGSKINFDRVVQTPKNIRSIETLELMSNAIGVVTANSTFSWWAAYLGTINSQVKTVTMPEKFTYLPNDPGLKLRVPGWKVISI